MLKLNSKSFILLSEQTERLHQTSFKSHRYLQQLKYKCDSSFHVSRFRQKSARASIFGDENYSKKWMQQIKIEIPMHRNQKLGKLVFDKLKRLIPTVKYNSALKSLKDHTKVLKILLGIRPRQETIKISDNNKRGSLKKIPNFIIQKSKQPQKPLLKLFSFNKSLIISQPLFNRVHRNFSQGHISCTKLSQNDSPEKSLPLTQQKRLSVQIRNIYGVKPFSNI
ncbi:unnamed protein product (macronuclear) [Paramecium tetraurelia]|uniref:Uncharacterized protein n=1 Tax=Paramecium tetraurelia TaxID=5888 RepID=A0BLJ1_PARTE|nr:uncharacterized protein GSPATT00030041001 [Paramecium tetraurelia]CAK59408.1 unnamed protein product [Paramecium tetraurelia]|eukprot:XP_001426806.1 hypothetical protein (macronuclear) [Paramecium tetraurelia strain d4-2]